MDKHVLITGGAGEVARFVAEELRHTYQVTLFDIVSPLQSAYPWETDLPFVMGDLTSLADCMRAISLSQAEGIVHLGAIRWATELQPGMSTRQNAPLPENETMRVNTMGTYYLLDAARRLGVKKVVFASTFYVLGLGNRISDQPFQVDYLPINEDHPCRPESTYGLSKLMNEEMLAAFSRAYDMQTVALRLSGVDNKTARGLPGGQGTTCPRKLVPRPDWVGGPINTTHQYVDVRDVALACRLSLEAQGLDPFEAFYIQTDSAYAEDTREVVEALYPDLRHLTANLQNTEGMITGQKAREKLGFIPQHSWRNKEK